MKSNIFFLLMLIIFLNNESGKMTQLLNHRSIFNLFLIL